MALQPGDEVTAGCLFDHFGQRFEDLLLGLGDVLQTMDQQVLHRFYVLGEDTIIDTPFAMMAGERSCRSAVPFRTIALGAEMADELHRFADLLGRAAMDVWGDMPREIQEALFETAMKGRSADREALARLLHDRHPRTLHPAKPD